MIVPGSASPLLLPSGDTTTPCGGSISTPSYVIKNSLRFRSSATGYLSRTPTVSGSQTTWVYSAWVKRAALGTYYSLFGAGANGSTVYDAWRFEPDNTISLFRGNGVYANNSSQAVFRDPFRVDAHLYLYGYHECNGYQ